MEVHAHSHTERKKWTHYLWEFLMLFLAVFCGFLAEYQLEHKIEKDREKQYIKSMILDLETDTAVFRQQVENAHYALTQLDTLINLLDLPVRTESQEQQMYFLGRISSRIIPFYYLHDQTYDQMKSSGNLRLFHSHNIAEEIAEYYSNKNYTDIQNGILVNRQTILIESLKKVFNSSVFHKMQDILTTNTSPPSGNPPLFSNDKSLINELIGSIHYFSTVGAVNTNNIEKVNKEGAALINFIKKEYHLK